MLIEVVHPFKTLTVQYLVKPFFVFTTIKKDLYSITPYHQIGDQPQGNWPLRLLVDHQKIVFTTTLSTTVTLTNGTCKVWRFEPKYVRVEAGLGLVDHIINVCPLPSSTLKPSLLVTLESVSDQAAMTDGENDETDQKVNKYLHRLQPLIKSRVSLPSSM